MASILPKPTSVVMYARTLVAVVLLASACDAAPDDVGGDRPGAGGKADDGDETEAVRVLDQGWDAAQRARMYRLDEGSQFIPRAWLLALPGADGKRFASPDNMATYGWLPDPVSDSNPDGLPVGFTTDGEHVGFNCTACHTAQIEIRGQQVRIDGGSTRADIGRFQRDVLRAMEATFEDADAFEAFATDVLGDDIREEHAIDALSREVGDWIDAMSFRLSFAEGAPVGGAGRLDGVGQATNETLCIDFDLPEACDTFNAPTNPGFIWGLGDLAWVQSNGMVHGPIGRNVGQAMGTFGQTSLREDILGVGGASTSVPMFALVELEEGFEELRAPRWDDPAWADLLPPLDADAVSRGRGVFEATCAGCHGSRSDGPFTEPNEHGRAFVEVPVTPLDEIGTDPGFVEDLLGEKSLAHPDFIDELDDAYLEAFGTTDPSVPVRAFELRALVIVAAIEHFVTRNPVGILDLGLDRFQGFRDSTLKREADEVRGYRAQPLEGIAFTGPFLHNGSVRTLAELLEPSTARAESFWVGGPSFDPDAVGFVTDADEPNAFFFDTTLPGNDNRGHEGTDYGTDLPTQDKADLLAYLKSL